MKKELITAPVGFPISLELVESALNLPSGTDTDLLNLYISSATEDLENDVEMALISQGWRFNLDKFPTNEYPKYSYSQTGTYFNTIFIPKGVTISVDVLKYIDTDDVEHTLIEGTDFTLTKTGTEARIEPVDSWFDTFSDKNDTVTIDVTLGLGVDDTEMPGWVKTALILKIKGLYDDCFDTYEKAYNSAIVTRKLYFDYSKNDR